MSACSDDPVSRSRRAVFYLLLVSGLLLAGLGVVGLIPNERLYDPEFWEVRFRDGMSKERSPLAFAIALAGTCVGVLLVASAIVLRWKGALVLAYLGTSALTFLLLIYAVTSIGRSGLLALFNPILLLGMVVISMLWIRLDWLTRHPAEPSRASAVCARWVNVAGALVLVYSVYILFAAAMFASPPERPRVGGVYARDISPKRVDYHQDGEPLGYVEKQEIYRFGDRGERWIGGRRWSGERHFRPDGKMLHYRHGNQAASWEVGSSGILWPSGDGDDWLSRFVFVPETHWVAIVPEGAHAVEWGGEGRGSAIEGCVEIFFDVRRDCTFIDADYKSIGKGRYTVGLDRVAVWPRQDVLLLFELSRRTRTLRFQYMNEL